MKITILMLAIIPATFSANAQKLKESEVPTVVRDAFKMIYPEAEEIRWEKEDEKYEAEFETEEQEQSVLLDYNGNVLETEIEIPPSQLPAIITESVIRDYKGAKIKGAAKITDANGIVTYEAEIKGKDLIFDGSGKLIKEVINQ